ncbi:fucoxanthin chlorophyll a c protein [Mayamaea pseudoterrestris]|nr:fucoxanthin chlorophyll a c protein [Mayamaea pseudoterrestris]
MKTIIAASLVASAAAFAPASQQASSTSVKAFEGELGAQAPLGFFDPLGLVADGDQAKFDRLRGVELKHGRVSQLAFLGYLTTWSGVRLPGMLSTSEGIAFADVPGGHEAVFKVPTAGLLQILAFCGALEVAGWKQAAGSFPGDFSASSFPVGFLGDESPEEQLELRAKELNQGRAAMMGILGCMVHEQLDGKPFIFFG